MEFPTDTYIELEIGWVWAGWGGGYQGIISVNLSVIAGALPDSPAIILQKDYAFQWRNYFCNTGDKI